MTRPINYEKRVDIVDSTVMYVGKAASPALDSSECWQLKKVITGADGDVTVTFAGGIGNYNFSWLLRTTYTYGA